MRRAGAALALLVAPLVANGSALSATAQDITARPDQRVQLDFQHYYTVRELEVALNSLASAYPEYLRLESLGRSAGGRELWLMTITRLQGEDSGQKPALFIGAGLGESDLQGTEMALFTILELVQNHGRNPVVERVLADAVIYVAPCLNPDLRARVLGGEETTPSIANGDSPGVGGTALDLNFEIGWSPDVEGSGPYPLSQAETRSAASFLLAHSNIGVVQTYAGVVRDGTPAGLTSIPERDRALYAQVGDAARDAGRDDRVLRCLPEVHKAGGSLLEFGYGHRGAFGFVTVVAGAANGGAMPEVFELFPLGRRAYQSTLRLARALPRLELDEPVVTRLRGDLWQIDLMARNAGTLPTLSALGEERFACGSPRLVAAGAKLVAAALRREPDAPFEVVDADDGRLTFDHLAGGGSIAVRLVVAAEAETALALELKSSRAGGASTTVELR